METKNVSLLRDVLMLIGPDIVRALLFWAAVIGVCLMVGCATPDGFTRNVPDTQVSVTKPRPARTSPYTKHPAGPAGEGETR